MLLHHENRKKGPMIALHNFRENTIPISDQLIDRVGWPHYPTLRKIECEHGQWHWICM
jgi:hypothetical protein